MDILLTKNKTINGLPGLKGEHLNVPDSIGREWIEAGEAEEAIQVNGKFVPLAKGARQATPADLEKALKPKKITPPPVDDL